MGFNVFGLKINDCSLNPLSKCIIICRAAALNWITLLISLLIFALHQGRYKVHGGDHSDSDFWGEQFIIIIIIINHHASLDCGEVF